LQHAPPGRLAFLDMAEVIFERIAPVFTVHDLDGALARYRQLGFATELDKRAQYGFVVHRVGSPLWRKVNPSPFTALAQGAPPLIRLTRASVRQLIVVVSGWAPV